MKTEPEVARLKVKGEVVVGNFEYAFKNQVRRKFHARLHDFRRKAFYTKMSSKFRR